MSGGLVAAPAAAQVSSPYLPTREQVQPPVPQAAPESQVRVDGNRAFRETPCPFETSDARVAISRVNFTGLDGQALPPELRRILAKVTPGAGEQPIVQICDLRDTANRLLREAGYVASVQIPPQEIVGGDLALTVITARIVDIKVESATSRYTSLIAARAEKLKGIDPFNQYDAERILLLAGDVPGLDVQLSLSPAGTRPGEVIGTLNVRYRPFAIVTNMQNYSSKSLGRETAFSRAEVYGITGLADLTYAGISSTFDKDEQQVLQLGHSFSPDGETRIQGDFTYAWSRPDSGLDQRIKINSRSMVGTIAITSPYIRSTTVNVNGTAGIDIIEQKTRLDFFGLDLPFSSDKLRVAFLRLAGSYVRPNTDGHGYSLSGALEIRRGLDIFGANQRYQGLARGDDRTPASRSLADPEATVARLDLDGQFSVGPIFTLGTSIRAQRASDPLMNYEQFSIGSLTIGRGYDPGAYSGDSALGARNEIRAAVYRSEKIGAEIYNFFDYAWLWTNLQRDPRNGAYSPEERRLFRSVGVGARVSLPGNYLIDVTYARPLDAIVPGDERPSDRLLLSLTAQFSPAAR